MILPGQVRSAPENSKGFDADSPIATGVAQAFFNNGFRFCIRYLSHEPQPGPRDLSRAEATEILLEGLALMPLQHVRAAGWSPSRALGTQDGDYAVQHANAVGFPRGVNVWCDLAGVGNATAQSVIDYCNAWYDAVAGGGFVPGLYVGANAVLSGEQLYEDLRFQHYWKSLSNVPAIPVLGYQMIQTPVHRSVHGISIAADTTQTDSKGGRVQWLIV